LPRHPNGRLKCRLLAGCELGEEPPSGAAIRDSIFEVLPRLIAT